MVLGHHVQVVARLETGDEVVALQRRAGDARVERVTAGDRVRLDWSPTAALLLGPVDEPSEAAAPEPVQARA
jgi:hypothetical protein